MQVTQSRFLISHRNALHNSAEIAKIWETKDQQCICVIRLENTTERIALKSVNENYIQNAVRLILRSVRKVQSELLQIEVKRSIWWSAAWAQDVNLPISRPLVLPSLSGSLILSILSFPLPTTQMKRRTRLIFVPKCKPNTRLTLCMFYMA